MPGSECSGQLDRCIARYLDGSVFGDKRALLAGTKHDLDKSWTTRNYRGRDKAFMEVLRACSRYFAYPDLSRKEDGFMAF